MNIVHLIYDLGNGGAEKFAVELCNELSLNNNTSIISVAPIEDWMLPPKKLYKNIVVRSYGKRVKYHPSLFFWLFNEFMVIRPDIVHVHSSILVLYMALIQPFFRELKFIHTIHSTFTPGYNKLYRFLGFLPINKKKIKHVCISSQIKNEYDFHFKKFHFENIDNGILPMQLTDQFDLVKRVINSFKKNNESTIFIAIGNFTPFKNFEALVRVFKNLEKQEENIALVILGKDSEGVNFKEVNSKKGNNTHLLGIKENVADYIGAGDALVMSSIKEGMPLVVLEALSLGKPVVSTPAGGVIDIIQDEVNGCLAKDFSDQSLEEAIIRFITFGESEKKNIGEHNKTLYHSKFTMKICAEKYLKLYAEP